MLAARTGLSPLMVGRARELARLTAVLTAPEAGPHVALVAGEGGVGKTRLVQELLAAVPTDRTVLTGQAAPGTPGRPFGVLLDAVEPLVAGWDAIPGALERDAEPLEVLLADVVPAVGCRVDRQYAQEELLRAAVALVAHLLGDRRGVVVFEDLHDADPESIAVFGRLAVEPSLDALVLGTFRPEDLGRRHPLGDLLVEIERRRTVTHVSLARLSPHDVADFLAAVYRRPVSLTVAQPVHARTGGNPFFLEELVVTAGDVDPEQLAVMPLPWSLTEAVIRHVDELGPELRRVLDAAAVLGQRFNFDLLAAVTGRSEDDLIDALREIVGRGLLLETEPDVFAFRHALTHEAVAGQLLGRERRRLHEKALAALQESGSDDWAAIAHHAEGAGRFDELVAAARHGAAQYLRKGSTSQALQLATLGLSEAEADRELHSLAARAAWMTGFLDRAIAHGEQWRRLARAEGDAEDEALALRHLARFHWERGDEAAQWAVAREAVTQAEAREASGDLAFAYNLMAETHMLNGRSAEAIDWADRALATADRVGCDPVRPAALVNKGSALIDIEAREAEGVELLEHAVSLAKQTGDDHSALRGLNNLVKSRLWHWDPARTRAALDEARELAIRSGRAGNMLAFMSLHWVEVAAIEGDQAAATAAVSEGRLYAPSTEDRDYLYVLGLDVEIALERGDLEHASAGLVELGRLVDDPHDRVWLACLRASDAARRADLDAAQRQLAAAMAQAGDLPPIKFEVGAFTRGLLDALGAGLEASAARALLGSLRAAGVRPQHEISWTLPLADAAVAEREGDLRGALAGYERVLADERRLPAIFLAEAERGAARCHLGLGDRDAARRFAEAAVRRLDRWPGWRRADAEALLDRVGTQSASPDGLTAREREVAALVAEGLTNGEIATRLYISAKTASVHVSNILMKLGMSSRAEIAAWAVGTGLARPGPAVTDRGARRDRR